MGGEEKDFRQDQQDLLDIDSLTMKSCTCSSGAVVLGYGEYERAEIGGANRN